MVRINVVVLGRGLAVVNADTMIVKAPAGAVDAVVRVKTDMQVGVQEGEENEAVADQDIADDVEGSEVRITTPAEHVFK